MIFFFFFENARLTLVQSLIEITMRGEYLCIRFATLKLICERSGLPITCEAAKFLASIRCFASGLFNRLPIAYLTIIVLYIPDTNRIDPANLNGIF